MTEKPKVRRGRRLLTGLVAGLVLGGGAGGYAWYTTQQAATALQQEQADQLDACRQVRKGLEEHAAAASARLSVLEARVEVARALMELDERNFGSAKKSMAAARAVLAKADLEGKGEVVAAFQEFRLVVGDDLAESRQALLGFSQSLDQLLTDL